MFSMPFPESQGQNLALTVLYVPYSLDSGTQAITPTPGSVLSSFEDLQLSGSKGECRTNERAGDSLEQAFADAVHAQRVKQLAPKKGTLSLYTAALSLGAGHTVQFAGFVRSDFRTARDQI